MMRFCSFFFLTCLLCQCSTIDLSQKKIQQGNLIPPQKIARLHLGMSQTDVKTLLGTSLINPLFNEERLDYVTLTQRGLYGKPEKTHVSLLFKQDRLVAIQYA